MIAESRDMLMERSTHIFIIIIKRLMSNAANITCRRTAAASGVRPNNKAYLKLSVWSVITQMYISLQGFFFFLLHYTQHNSHTVLKNLKTTVMPPCTPSFIKYLYKWLDTWYCAAQGFHQGQVLDELLTSVPASCGDQKGHLIKTLTQRPEHQSSWLAWPNDSFNLIIFASNTLHPLTQSVILVCFFICW